LGSKLDVAVELERMLFSSQDIEDGKNKPPLMILNVIEIPRSSCMQVYGGTYNLGNRCLAIAGLRASESASDVQKQPAITYYCLLSAHKRTHQPMLHPRQQHVDGWYQYQLFRSPTHVRSNSRGYPPAYDL
jgi:hypothetical protein